MTQTIGQKLKAAREEKQLTLEKVFEATRIRVPFLRALESDDLSSMPSPVQARGYLRNYAEYLGLNFDQLLDEMRAEHKLSDEIIGPADLIVEPATQTPEPIQTEVEAPADEPSPPPQPKPARRKKADSQPEPATKRRGPKKVEPEPELPPEVGLPPEIIEEPVVQIEPEPEPVLEEVIQPQLEATHTPNVSDNLWQTWLNRLGAVISMRVNRKVDSPFEPDSPQVETENLQPETLQPAALSESKGSNVQQSGEIFKEIGAELRKRRELLSLHLEEVERNTHVKAHYLHALEEGAMDSLPSTVQTRGMLSNYATFLDLDVDTLLLRFADALQARHRERNPQKPARKQGQPILANLPSISTFIAGDMVFGIGIAVLLVGFAIWGINRVVTIQNMEEAQPTAKSISEVLLASPDPSQFTATATFLPVESFPGEATATIIIPTQNLNVSVQVNLIANERTYMRVLVDGDVVFEGRVVPGNAYLFEAEDQVEVLVGSGTAIRVVYNGHDLGLMGGFGQVVNNIYRADEIITPTALPAPTVTSTVSPTPTVRPTSTVRPTNTPIPSKTP